ncbi:hypothetical protein YC2023_098064 [Brassica napus]
MEIFLDIAKRQKFKLLEESTSWILYLNGTRSIKDEDGTSIKRKKKKKPLPLTDENDEAHRIDCFLHYFFSDLPLVPRAFPCYSDFIISPNQSVTLDLTKSIEKIDRINCSCGVFYSPAPSVGDAIDGTLDFISHLLFSFSSLPCKRMRITETETWTRLVLRL